MKPSSIEGASSNLPDPKITAKATPFGFGSKVTGGGKAQPQTPKNAAELEAWLTDKVPRVIRIDKIYDFTSPTNTTIKGWVNQILAASDDWCSKEKNLPGNVPVSAQVSPLNPIKIQGQKTLVGFTCFNEPSVHKPLKLIQLIHQLSSLECPHYLAQSIRCRQMIAGGGMHQVEANTGITISNNLFSGKTKWSQRCNNRHYWTILISGADDEVTMARKLSSSSRTYIHLNQIIQEENVNRGRAPKTGGTGNPKVSLHYYNNVHTNILGETFEIGSGSNVLAEGNIFDNVKIQNPSDIKTQDAGHSQVLDNLKRFPVVAQANILPASSIQREVSGQCGAGHI
ncbi:hypothetical protein PtA15_7A476 [Puccinia triticina]|nr:uncharacterized protein PtA15_7A476 [Puccinia triticina]WAQ86748.1 hypothetical protein PtA15_7A476 [Puccinia triticina]